MAETRSRSRRVPLWQRTTFLRKRTLARSAEKHGERVNPTGSRSGHFDTAAILTIKAYFALN